MGEEMSAEMNERLHEVYATGEREAVRQSKKVTRGKVSVEVASRAVFMAVKGQPFGLLSAAHALTAEFAKVLKPVMIEGQRPVAVGTAMKGLEELDSEAQAQARNLQRGAERFLDMAFADATGDHEHVHLVLNSIPELYAEGNTAEDQQMSLMRELMLTVTAGLMLLRDRGNVSIDSTDDPDGAENALRAWRRTEEGAS